MGYMAQWGPKGFLVSPTKIASLENLKTSVTLKSDSENDTSGTAPTNTRGREAIPITFSVTYNRAAGVDPRAQKEEWESLVGQSYPLYVGGKRFGPERLILKKVDFDITLSSKGDFLSVTVSVALEEYANSKTSVSSNTSSTGAKNKAMNTTASASDKADKKSKSTLLDADAKANTSLSRLIR